MTPEELNDKYVKLIGHLIGLETLGEVDYEITLDMSEEWAFLCYGGNIYLEFTKDEEIFKAQVVGIDCVNTAMHKVIDMSNNEDQGD